MLALAALLACSPNIYDTVDPVVHVSTPTVWTGTVIVLTSDDFTGRDTLPLVVVGTDTVSATFAPPDTLRVATPDSQGIYTVWVALHGRALVPVGTVHVEGGYAGWHRMESVDGYPLRWPGGGLPSFLIGTPTGLARVDPRSWMIAPLLPDSVFSQRCIIGPGPATAGRVAVQGWMATGCGPLVAVRLDAPGLAPDTGPNTAGAYFAAQLGPGRWLAFAHHGVSSWHRSPAGAWVGQGPLIRLDTPHGIAISPRGDRAVGLGRDAGGLGIPVFTPTSPAPAYWLTLFRELWGAQFSDDGDTLYVVGVPTDSAAYPTPVLAALAASDGAVLRSAPGWPHTQNLVLDPGRPWLYLVGYTAWGTGQAVHVVDRATFASVTTLVVPAGALAWDLAILYPMLYASMRRLYLVETCQFCTALGSAPPIIVFDLMP